MAKRISLAFCCLFLIVFSKAQNVSKDDVEEMIEEAGFQSERHYAETKDGYILKIHRILKKSPIPQAGPVFMLHGVLETSADYIRTGPQLALPYLLSQLGFDVWLGNVRGNDHSLAHRTLSVDSKEFWDFSFHEFGMYDLPAMFDLMLKVTNSPKGFFFGHSQGGSSYAVMNSMHPEFNEKIIQAHLFAPAVFMKYIPSPFREPVKVAVELMANRDSYGMRNKDFAQYADQITEIFCKDSGLRILNTICVKVLCIFCGFNKGEQEMDGSIMQDYLEHMTHSISLKQILHYFQLYKSGRFTPFDYGDQNLRVYGSPTPPDYPLSRIETPVFIYSAGCDTLVSEPDLRHFSELLPNLMSFKVFENYNHCDFLYGKNSRSEVFYDIIRSMIIRTDIKLPKLFNFGR